MTKDPMDCQTAEEFLKEYPNFEEQLDETRFEQIEQSLKLQAEREGVTGMVWAIKLRFSDGWHYFTRKNLKYKILGIN